MIYARFMSKNAAPIDLLLHFNLVPDDVICYIRIDGEPITKARPQFTTRGGVKRAYTPHKTIEGERMLGYMFRSQISSPVDYPVGVACIFGLKNRKKIDVDNCVKAVLDSANRIVWNDDQMVTQLRSEKWFDQPAPFTQVIVFRGLDTRSRCKYCGEVIKRPLGNKAVYCDKTCRAADHRPTYECAWCHKTFQRRVCNVQGNNVYCSLLCANKHKGAIKTATRGPDKGVCQMCGGPTTKREYKVCAECRVPYLRTAEHRALMSERTTGVRKRQRSA